MKKILALLLSALMLLGLLAACGTPAAEESAPPSGEESAAPASEAPAPAEPVELKVWHDGDEAIMQTIADTVNPHAFADERRVTVTFEKQHGPLRPAEALRRRRRQRPGYVLLRARQPRHLRRHGHSGSRSPDLADADVPGGRPADDGRSRADRRRAIPAARVFRDAALLLQQGPLAGGYPRHDRGAL